LEAKIYIILVPFVPDPNGTRIMQVLAAERLADLKIIRF
jgi:hypothetical protein